MVVWTQLYKDSNTPLACGKHSAKNYYSLGKLALEVDKFGVYYSYCVS